jgi:hypothetical protein
MIRCENETARSSLWSLFAFVYCDALKWARLDCWPTALQIVSSSHVYLHHTTRSQSVVRKIRTYREVIHCCWPKPLGPWISASTSRVDCSFAYNSTKCSDYIQRKSYSRATRHHFLHTKDVFSTTLLKISCIRRKKTLMGPTMRVLSCLPLHRPKIDIEQKERAKNELTTSCSRFRSEVLGSC